MALEFRPLPKAIGAQVLGLDPHNMSAEDITRFRDAFNRNSVLLIRDLPLDPAAHIELTRALGEPDIHPIPTGRLEGYPEILVPKPYGLQHSDNPDEIIGRIPWHADVTFTATPPRAALLRAIEIPQQGGQTGFIDSAAVYAALDEATKQRIHGVEIIHRMVHGQRMLGFDVDDEKAAEVSSKFPDVAQPLVLRDLATGTESLNISPLFADEVIGMDRAAGDALIRELTDFATQDRFIYWHDWQPDDLIIWNNYRTLHSAAGHPQRYSRTMHRTTVKATEPVGRPLAQVA